MAAYAATVSSKMRSAERLGNSEIGLFCGEVDITNYNATNVAITAISKKFRTVYAVVLNSMGENADYIARWNGTSIDCYVANTGAQVADDVDVGKFSFVAFGSV